MSDQRNGGIVWCEQTWNPLRGCTRVSAGCMNCYAESMAARFCGTGQPYEGTINPETKRWNGNIKLVPEHLQDPLRWKRPRMVFVNSMSDLFHESVPDEFIDQVFAVMALASQHTFQVLTKRPERMHKYFEFHFTRSKCGRLASDMTGIRDDAAGIGDVRVSNMQFPLPNVWLGVTVENQQAADERIPLLLQTPAAVRWVSMEPLLGPVDLKHGEWIPPQGGGSKVNLFRPWETPLPSLDWVIVGGESGTNARPMHPNWVRSLRDQCAAAGVPFLFKQWGEWIPRSSCYHQMESGRSLADIDPSCEIWKCIRLNENGKDGRDLENEDGGDSAYMQRVGKKMAGRLIDGKLHDEYPKVNP